MNDLPNQQFSADYLADKVAVVTGGSRGLGKEMCRAFARCGAHVVIASRKAEPCEALAAELISEHGVKAKGVACHAARWDDCDRLVETVYDEFGKVDVLVNNAGSAPLYESLSSISEELFDKTIGVNLKGPFRLSALCGERMAAGDGGSIINISSIAAVQPSAAEVPYGMAKAALNNLTIALAHMLGPRVRVNSIMPGPFLTDISKAWPQEAHEGLKLTPLGRGGEPHEIVDVTLLLAGSSGSYITGAVLKIDGGVTWPAA